MQPGSYTGQYRVNPYGQTRRMAHSEGMVTDDSGNTTQEAYTDTWSGAVSAPTNVQQSLDCDAEAISEPGL